MSSVALQSKDHRDLLDIIDKLRSRGISRYVDLPEIIVCGDQSAGKSSVLEAISGMSFPTKDNLCTRFATELVLRRQSTAGVKVSINAGPERSVEERARLSRFTAEVDLANPDIGAVIERAKEEMGLSDVKVFSTDTLRVELCGPNQPHLTMVDLPGLFRAGNRDQSIDDAATVRAMVRNLVRRPRSIILAVVSAKSDFALQEVTELTRELDPKGVRTLGLITKPDALDAGSDSEASYVRLAQNKDVVFRLGWHVLKNRDYSMRGATSEERDQAEEQFFASGVWGGIDHRQLGVKHLRPRLSNVLKDQILTQLPALLQDVEMEIATARAQLQRLGTARLTLADQRRYLFQVSRDFSFLMKAAVDGEYSNPFFGNAKTADGYRKRLRARVQNTLTDFEQTMRLTGKNRVISDGPVDPETSPGRISRTAYVDEVKDLMKRSRGRELPGTFNPLIISELFTEQCQPWKQMTADVEQAILQVIYQVAQAIVNHVSVGTSSREIFTLINTSIDPLRTALHTKLAELLRPHYESHPITFNHYLTDTVQKVQAQRRQRQLEENFKRSIGSENFEEKKVIVRPASLLAGLQQQTEVDMERYGSELATDYMEAYYKVSIPLLLFLS